MSKAVRVAATILLAACCMVILCEGAWEEDPSRWEETTLTAPRHSDDGAFNEMEDQQASDQLNIKNQIANTNPIAEEAPTAGVALSEVDDYKPRSRNAKAAGSRRKKNNNKKCKKKCKKTAKGAERKKCTQKCNKSNSVALSEVDDDANAPRSSDDKAAGSSAKRRRRRRRKKKKNASGANSTLNEIRPSDDKRSDNNLIQEDTWEDTW